MPAPSFDEYGTLPGNLVNPAKQVKQFSDYFVDPESQQFRWQEFKDSIDNRPDTDMVIEQYDNNTIVQQDVALEEVIEKVGDLLGKIAGAFFDKDAIIETLVNSFTGLKEKEDSGVAHYDEQGGGTAFTYRVLFKVPNEHIPTDFYALVSTVKLAAADIDSKESWFGLVKDSRQGFSAEVEAMKLACNENFQAGTQPSS
ncbi:hypothetical protein RSOLAG1IB_11037 [Rhizoctonia solani AG-1 IB]|uniref:Uncharacterized protein n=1 Tax=Thanatephorus cucumeris (strain AG1-IB / isolate 7/3/14) TaxID=1108050 RepID=M5C8J0_THACB|nr:hypothetical protein BN14_10446 [Rhizoctonia solani AG-1 IB]CEL64053.1 hypothetical protein RSOLAG1IB_11037 [Rhizoctonia solani AG-1 IB]